MKAITCLLILGLVGCSHIPLDDARWIIQNAKTIHEVEERLGKPEKQEFSRDLAGRGLEKATYIDPGMHVSLGVLLGTAGIGSPLLIVIFPLEWALGGFHRRSLTIEYSVEDGQILDAYLGGPGASHSH